MGDHPKGGNEKSIKYMVLKEKCKKCRRSGQKLFLKSERCFSQKCSMIRTPYAPGLHGRAKKREMSEYGRQLAEKQRFKLIYGVLEKQFKNYVLAATKEKGDNRENLLKKLEMRLDNVVYKLGLAKARYISKQIVGHGHILVNNHKTDIPSYQLKVGDVISIRERSKKSSLFKDLAVLLKKYETPSWLSLDKDKLEGKIISQPVIEDQKELTGVGIVIEYYSR